MKLFKLATLTSLSAIASIALAGEIVYLPVPVPDPNLVDTSLVEAVQSRHSDRKYSEEPISMQQLGDLLWFAVGVNRPDGRRTAPTALNKQEITAYAITPKGAYKYLPSNHTMEKVSDKDLRPAVAGGQKFVETAPLAVVYTAHMDAFPPGERSTLMYGIDAGHASENLLLYCAIADLACVPRMTMDNEALTQELGLTGLEKPVFNNVIGHPVK